MCGKYSNQPILPKHLPIHDFKITLYKCMGNILTYLSYLNTYLYMILRFYLVYMCGKYSNLPILPKHLPIHDFKITLYKCVGNILTYLSYLNTYLYKTLNQFVSFKWLV